MFKVYFIRIRNFIHSPSGCFKTKRGPTDEGTIKTSYFIIENFFVLVWFCETTTGKRRSPDSCVN